MDARSMLKREDFFSVLFETIKQYYKVVHGIEVDISSEKRKNTKKVFIYYMPLFASTLPVTKGMKKFLYSEYNIRGNLLKYIVGKLGVFFITNSFGVAAYKHFYIGPADKIKCNYFISPCNRTVRFYDFEQDYVDCIVKSGYKPDFLFNQLKFRINNTYSFVPEIIAYGSNWYRERIMHGNALVRVRDDKIVTSVEKKVLSIFTEIAAETMEYKSAKTYLNELREQIIQIISEVPEFKRCKCVETVYKLLNNVAHKLKDSSISVPIVLSHGDLQGGNIWVTKQGEVIVYDWETYGRRTVWFDLATYFGGLHSNGLAINIDKILQDPQVMGNYKQYNSSELEMISHIILLEDVLFYLNDVAQLPGEFAHIHFTNICEKLKKWEK